VSAARDERPPARPPRRGVAAARAVVVASGRGPVGPEGSPIVRDAYTAVIKQSGPWWIGWIEEVPGVNCQERTREELLETLRVTLREALELNRDEARKAAGGRYEEALITL